MKKIVIWLAMAVVLSVSWLGYAHSADIPQVLGMDWSPDRGSTINKDPMGATCTSDDGGSTCECAAGCWGNATGCGCTQGKGIPFKTQQQAATIKEALKSGNYEISGSTLKIGNLRLKATKQGFLSPGIKPPVRSATCTSGDGKASCDCAGFCKAGQTSCRCGHKDTLKTGWGDGLEILGPNDY